jgi:hypothetical protein
LVKTGRSEVKPNSPSSELGASSGSEEEVDWVKESEDAVDVECLYCALCSLKTATVKNGFDAKKSTVGISYTVFAHYLKRAFVCGRCKK